MIKRLLLVISLLALALTTACSPSPEQAETIAKEFATRGVVELKTVSSNVVIQQADIDKVSVDITASYSPKNSFKLNVNETAEKLTLTETFGAVSTRGTGEWVVTVPYGVSVVIGTASGDVRADSFRGNLTVKTASGKVVINNAEGVYDISTASGHITANKTNLLGESTFGSASGHVEVTLAASLSDNLTIKTASGNAILNYGDYPLTGTVAMVSRIDKGKIKSPYEPDHSEEFSQGGTNYIKKTYLLGQGSPEVMIWTASGESILRAK